MLGVKVIKEQYGNTEKPQFEIQTPRLSSRRCNPEVFIPKTAGDEEAMKPPHLYKRQVGKNRFGVEREYVTPAMKGFFNMAKNEKTSPRVATIASKLLSNPKTPPSVRSVAATALTQAPDRKARKK